MGAPDRIVPWNIHDLEHNTQTWDVGGGILNLHGSPMAPRLEIPLESLVRCDWIAAAAMETGTLFTRPLHLEYLQSAYKDPR